MLPQCHEDTVIIFKFNPIHASVIYQFTWIRWIHWNPVLFRENSITFITRKIGLYLFYDTYGNPIRKETNQMVPIGLPISTPQEDETYLPISNLRTVVKCEFSFILKMLIHHRISHSPAIGFSPWSITIWQECLKVSSMKTLDLNINCMKRWYNITAITDFTCYSFWSQSTLTGVGIISIYACAPILTGTAYAFINFLTKVSSVSCCTIAFELVHIFLSAWSTILTWHAVAFIYIYFTDCSSKSSNTATSESLFNVHACCSILTRTTVTFIHLHTYCSKKSCNTVTGEVNSFSLSSHGLLSHSSTSVSHMVPEKPAGHMHV